MVKKLCDLGKWPVLFELLFLIIRMGRKDSVSQCLPSASSVPSTERCPPKGESAYYYSYCCCCYQDYIGGGLTQPRVGGARKGFLGQVA